MTKKLGVSIEQLEAKIQRAMLEIAVILMYRELRHLLPQRLARYESIEHDHYELIPIVNDLYEPLLQRTAPATGTRHQELYKMCKEGCICRYCLDQADRDPQNRYQDVEGAHGTTGVYESLQDKPFLNEASSENHTHYSLLNNSPVFSRGGETKALLFNDHSQSTRSRLSRRKHRGRKSDNDDEGIDGDLIPLEQIKQKREETEDVDFISKLLSNVKRESITNIVDAKIKVNEKPTTATTGFRIAEV